MVYITSLEEEFDKLKLDFELELGPELLYMLDYFASSSDKLSSTYSMLYLLLSSETCSSMTVNSFYFENSNSLTFLKSDICCNCI